jgi:LEA14-like dessication related protein
VGADGLDIIVKGTIRNRNPFPVLINRMTYSASVNGHHVGDGEIAKTTIIPPKMAIPIQDELNPDAAGAIDAGGSWLSGDKPVVTVDGTVYIAFAGGTIQIPFQKSEQTFLVELP